MNNICFYCKLELGNHKYNYVHIDKCKIDNVNILIKINSKYFNSIKTIIMTSNFYNHNKIYKKIYNILRLIIMIILL